MPGADAAISKPLTTELLLTKVAKVLRIKSS
jgi:hypothetical protein